MCDQDHFENDLQEYEARGLVTRRQFGMLLGAGVVMLLPQVANAVAVTESDVVLAGHLRAAAGNAPDGQAAR